MRVHSRLGPVNQSHELRLAEKVRALWRDFKSLEDLTELSGEYNCGVRGDLGKYNYGA